MKVLAFLAVLSAFMAESDRNIGGAVFRATVNSAESRLVYVETWWRIKMYELDNGRWRYAGSFENPDRSRYIRYGDAWKEGKPGYRTYTGPESFLR